MPIARFQMPDGRIARFEVPVGTTPEQATSMFNSFLAQQGQQEEPRRDVGIIESGVAGLKKLLSSQRTALETPFGAEEAAQRGAARARALEAETPSQLSLEAVKKKYAEEGLFPAAGEVMRQAPKFIAEQSPQLAEAFAGGRLGAIAGTPFGPAGPLVGGAIGALSPIFLQSYGTGAERRATEGLAQEPGKTLTSAVGQTAAEGLMLGFTFGGKLVGRMLGIGEREAAQALVNPATRELAEESLKKVLAKGGARGAIAEIPTEVTQQMLERWQADLPLLSPDALKEYQEAAYGATLFGTPVGAAARVVQRGGAREEVAQGEALQREAEAAQREAERQAQLQDPQYVLGVGDRFDALKAQEKALLAERGKKPGKGATDEAKEAYLAKTEELRALRTQIQELMPEYNEVKAKLPALREEIRVAGMTPEEYFAEIQGYKKEEKEAPPAKPAAEVDPMAAWMAQTEATTKKRPESETQQLLSKTLESTLYQNELTGNELTPDQVADALVNDPNSDMGLVAQVYNGTVKIPGFNKNKHAKLREYLQLQINELVANREEVQAQQKAIAEETEALQRMGQTPAPSIESPTQLGLLRELEGYAGEMRPGVAVAPRAVTRPKTTEDQQLLEKQARAKSIAQADKAKRESEDALEKLLTDKDPAAIAEAQKRYVNSVMDEVNNRRQAAGQEPVNEQKATTAQIQIATLLNLLPQRVIDEAAFREQLVSISNELMEGAGSQTKASLKGLAAKKIQPSAEVEPGLQKQNYKAKANDFAEQADDALVKIKENLDKIATGMTLGSSRPEVRKFASATADILKQQALEAKPRYIDAVMNEVANQRAAEGQQPINTEDATRAAAQMNVALDAFLNGQASEKALTRQLDVIRARLLTARPEPQRVEAPIRRQVQAAEAEKIAEARGETAQTLEGQLRRQRDYVGGLLERVIPSGKIARNARELLTEVQDAIDNNTATREVLDRAEDVANRVMLGQRVQDELPGLASAVRSMREAQAPGLEGGQRSLFDTADLGVIRASAANFQKFLKSQQVAKLRALLPQVRQAIPGVDPDFYRTRIDVLEKKIADAKENLEDLGDASWESIMQTRAVLPEEVRQAKQKLYALMQEQNALELAAEAAAETARKQKLSGTRGPYEAAQAEDKARKLKDQIRSKETNILETMRDLTAQIRAQRGQAIYGPIIQQFEQQSKIFEARLAELKAAMPEDARMSPEFDELFNEASALEQEIKVVKEGLEEARKRQAKGEGNEALLAAADERIVREKAKLKELQDKLAKVDLVGDARRQAQAEVNKQRAQVAVAERELANAKEAASKQAEEFKRRVATGEGLLKTKRTVAPVERENKKTGRKILLVEKKTGLPVREKKTEGAYVTREPVKGVGWGKPAKKSVPISKERRLSIEDEVEADEPVAKAQRAGAKENLEDFATVAGTLARQANVTDVAPRPKSTKPLRTAQGRDAAARFAKSDAKVELAKQKYGAKSAEYKKALRDAETRYFEKLGTEFEAGTPIQYDGTAFRIGEAVENAVDADQAQAFIDKVKAKLPKGIKFVYAKDLLNAPGKFVKAMARDGLDVNTSKVKGGVLPDGTVVVIGNHHNSLLDLEKTVAHELGHYGTDTLLGREGMDALYKALDKNKDGILGVARQLGVEEDVMDAAEAAARKYSEAEERGASKEELNDILREGQTRALREMLAHVQEASVDKGFLAKAGDFIKALVGAVRAALRKMGFAELSTASTSDIYYLLRKAHKGVYNNTLGAYRNPSGETVFRRGAAQYAADANPAFAAFNAKTGVAPAESTNKVFSNVTGLGARTALVDRFAPLKEVASYLKNSAEAMQMMYYARMHDQRMAFTATTATNGARTIEQDEKTGEYYITSAGTPSLKDVAETLAKVKGLGNSAAVRDAFDAYLKAYRAKRVGARVLNFEKPPTTAEIEATIAAGDAIPEFKEARRQYNEYNKGLINWLVKTGAIPKELGVQLSSTNDYVPFYRVQGDNVLFEIGDRTPITIGDIKNQPYLNELVGGKEDTKDFFTAALQNTALLTDMGLRNLATRQVAFTLQSAGLLQGKVNEITGKTKGIVKGTGPASPEVIRFKIDGVPHFARVDTDAIGVPAEMLVQGLHGTVTQMGGFVKLMSVPARFMRAMITRNPAYSVRQIVRDSTSNYLLTGGDMKPVVGALSELQKMWAGKSEGEKILQEGGVLGGQIISGTSEDMQKIMLQLVSGKPGWEQALAKLDRMAMKADASSRVALYNDFRKQGLSHMQATLAALESMNFSKRGTSGTLYKLNMMVPFLNAQIQGLNVLWEAFTGKLPYAEALKQKQKFYTRATMMSALTVMYAAMMQDDEAYENADMRTRLQNWFVRIPGVKDPLKIPIPFEVGLIFKALPEAVLLAGRKDAEAREVMKALGGMVAMSSPLGVSTQPQAIKPIIEATLNKSFFTGRDIESAQEQELLPSERVRAGTSELAKLFSQATGGTVSPIMIEHFASGYTGGLGLAIMQAANAILPTDREAPSKRLSEMPVIGSLFQASDAPGQITSMYERAKRYEQIKNTFDKYVDEGRAAEAQALAQRYSREIVFADIAEDFKKDVGELTTLEKQIRASALSADEKTERLKEIRQAKIALSKAFNVAAVSE